MRDPAKMSFDETMRIILLDVAGDREHRVVRCVVRAKELGDIVKARC